VKVGDVIVATVKAKNMTSMAGIQVNIKYDPEVLQAIDPATGKPFTEETLLVTRNCYQTENIIRC